MCGTSLSRSTGGVGGGDSGPVVFPATFNAPKSKPGSSRIVMSGIDGSCFAVTGVPNVVSVGTGAFGS